MLDRRQILQQIRIVKGAGENLADQAGLPLEVVEVYRLRSVEGTVHLVALVVDGDQRQRHQPGAQRQFTVEHHASRHVGGPGQAADWGNTVDQFSEVCFPRGSFASVYFCSVWARRSRVSGEASPEGRKKTP